MPMKALQSLIMISLDFFYPIFKRFMEKKTYYYLACGSSTTLLGFLIFYLSMHYLLHKEVLDLGLVVLKPHIASYFISFAITFPIGFLLSKYIVWNESYLRGRQQLFRHLILVVIFVLMNYLLLKLFVDVLHWWPMPSQVLATIIIVVMSYFSQKYYSFKN